MMDPPRRHDVTRLEFTVRGDPVAQPRARARAIKVKRGPHRGKFIGHVYNPDNADGWKERITIAARQAGLPTEPWAGPVTMRIDVYFARPKKLLGPEYPDGPFPHTTKPDRDNVEKAILDALKKCRLLKDDCFVWAGEVRKWWTAKGARAGARIVAELMAPQSRQLTLQDAREGDRR